jgi:hypothetical protein
MRRRRGEKEAVTCVYIWPRLELVVLLFGWLPVICFPGLFVDADPEHSIQKPHGSGTRSNGIHQSFRFGKDLPGPGRLLLAANHRLHIKAT